jgi:hypothetical protein
MLVVQKVVHFFAVQKVVHIDKSATNYNLSVN